MCDYLVECMKIIHGSGLEYVVHTHGTNMIGEYGRICEIVQRSIDVLHAMGVRHCSVDLKIDCRTDKQEQGVTLSSFLQKIKTKFYEEMAKNIEPVSELAGEVETHLSAAALEGEPSHFPEAAGIRSLNLRTI